MRESKERRFKEVNDLWLGSSQTGKADEQDEDNAYDAGNIRS